MDIIKQRKYFNIFVILFFILNVINTYFLTAQILNRYIAPLKRTFIGEVTAVIGNLSILVLIFIIVFSVFKKDKSKVFALLITTLFLNTFIFLLGYFNLFYGTALDVNSLDIFKNPSEGIANGLFKLLLSELILYFRILVFVPFGTLLFLTIKYLKYLNLTGINILYKINIKRIIIGITSFVLLFTTATLSFLNQLKKDNFNIGSVISTNSVQNYGVYPFYITNFLGIEFRPVNRKSMKLNSDEDIYNTYNEYNKNKSLYTNFIDNKTYSNNLKANETDLYINKEELNLNDDSSLTGVFEDKNLILVHLESFNYFLTQISDVNDRFIFLNQLLKESVVFDNYYTSVGMGVSSDAEVSVLTGLYVNGYSTFYRDYGLSEFKPNTLTDSLDTIPKLMNNKGYETTALHADYEVFYNRDIAYTNLIEFDDYYSLEDFYNDDPRKDEYKNLVDYGRQRAKNGYNYKGIDLVSSWPSEFELADKTIDFNNATNKNMVYSVYMTPHTPFMYNPYIGQEYSNFEHLKLKTLTKRYLEFATYIDSTIKSYFFDIETNESRINKDNVYVFYSDHGSSIKNGDLSKLFGRELELLEERRMLQQTISFIYAPGNEIDPVTNLNKGLIKGNQKLVRGHIDLYRTIGELFNLFNDDNFYFGVNALSNEPTFVIDNRIQDLVIDDLNKIDNDNYIPYLVNLRNLDQRFPKEKFLNFEYIIKKIKHFKKLSDLLLIDDKIYYDFKSTLQKK